MRREEKKEVTSSKMTGKNHGYLQPPPHPEADGPQRPAWQSSISPHRFHASESLSPTSTFLLHWRKTKNRNPSRIVSGRRGKLTWVGAAEGKVFERGAAVRQSSCAQSTGDDSRRLSKDQKTLGQHFVTITHY